eukprot:129101_1
MATPTNILSNYLKEHNGDLPSNASVLVAYSNNSMSWIDAHEIITQFIYEAPNKYSDFNPIYQKTISNATLHSTANETDVVVFKNTSAMSESQLTKPAKRRKELLSELCALKKKNRQIRQQRKQRQQQLSKHAPPTPLLGEYEWIVAGFSREHHGELPVNLERLIVVYIVIKHIGTWTASTSERGYELFSQYKTSYSLTINENDTWKMEISVKIEHRYPDRTESHSSEEDGYVIYQWKHTLLKHHITQYFDQDQIKDEWKAKFSAHDKICSLYRKKPNKHSDLVLRSVSNRYSFEQGVFTGKT